MQPSQTDLDDGIYIRIPISDCPLKFAYQAVDDPLFFDETMPGILAAFHLSVDEYWNLTAAQHARMVEWVKAHG
jgi:hypothetical protein